MRNEDQTITHLRREITRISRQHAKRRRARPEAVTIGSFDCSDVTDAEVEALDRKHGLGRFGAEQQDSSTSEVHHIPTR